jgi:hypothetical protein
MTITIDWVPVLTVMAGILGTGATLINTYLGNRRMAKTQADAILDKIQGDLEDCLKDKDSLKDQLLELKLENNRLTMRLEQKH